MLYITYPNVIFINKDTIGDREIAKQMGTHTMYVLKPKLNTGFTQPPEQL